MNATIVKLLKTTLVAGAVALVQRAVESAPDLLPLVPSKYAGLASLLVLAAGLYLKKPPSGGGGTGSVGPTKNTGGSEVSTPSSTVPFGAVVTSPFSACAAAPSPFGDWA